MEAAARAAEAAEADATEPAESHLEPGEESEALDVEELGRSGEPT
jgi:hypothetical protein